MAERDRPHIIVMTSPTSEPFTPPLTPGPRRDRDFTGSRSEHGTRLTEEFTAAWEPLADEPETTGTYLTFTSFPGLDLMFESLESQRPGAQPELVAVQTEMTPTGEVLKATVFIPDRQKEFFSQETPAVCGDCWISGGESKTRGSYRRDRVYSSCNDSGFMDGLCRRIPNRSHSVSLVGAMAQDC